MSHETKTVIEEHVKNMGLPESTGRQILDARAAVEEYLRNQAEITRITTETNEKKEAIETKKREVSNIYDSKIQALKDEERKDQKALDQQITDMKAGTDNTLKPLEDQITQVKRIIALLRIAETIQPVRDIGDSEITTYNGEYLEFLGYAYYNDEFLKIRLLITENRKPKNKYSLLAYGRCAFEDQKLLRRLYTYEWTNLKDYTGGFNVKYELGCFPSIDEIKKRLSKYPDTDKVLKTYIAEFGNLKQEYLEVKGAYKLSDFEQITAQEKAKERLK